MTDLLKSLPTFVQLATGDTGGVFLFGVLFGLVIGIVGMWAFHARGIQAQMQKQFSREVSALHDLHSTEVQALKDELARLRERFGPIEAMMHEALQSKLKQ